MERCQKVGSLSSSVHPGQQLWRKSGLERMCHGDREARRNCIWLRETVWLGAEDAKWLRCVEMSSDR